MSDTLKEKVRALPHKPGVYLMKDRLGTILYVGKAKDLKRRVSSYFQLGRRPFLGPKIKALVELIADFDFHLVRSETEALLLEGRLIKELKPKYNTSFTDDKQFIQIRVDLEAVLPVFKIVRVRTTDKARYFGPFPRATEVRRTLQRLRKQFGILLNDTHPQCVGENLYQLYDDARAEIYNHANVVSVTDYRSRVDAACEFLEGRDKAEIERLREAMRAAAETQEYERAAHLRDQIAALEATLEKSRKFIHGNPLPEPTTPHEAMRQLGEILQMPFPPRTMECFDISHISGTFVVSSCVHFRDGVPAKNEYRRFRINWALEKNRESTARTQAAWKAGEFVPVPTREAETGNNDFRSMRETILRRYSRLHREQKPMPDLIVIDGGTGQVSLALEAFEAIGIEPPMMIGMAKREEMIIFHDGRAPLKLSENSPALRLLQRLRDESHRFANTYNADLRSRKIRESVLDEMSGLGERRKLALLKKFKSIPAMKNATLEELASVDGIGERFAEDLFNFLKQI